MTSIGNTLNAAEIDIIQSLKGRTLDSVLITVTPAEDRGNSSDSQFSLTDVILRTDTDDILLHLAISDNPALREMELYSLQIQSGPIGSFPSSYAENERDSGWHALPVGRRIKETRIYEDEQFCEVTSEGTSYPVRDTGTIALIFDASCLILSKNAFMDNWRIQFQESSDPDVDGLLNEPKRIL